MDLLQRFENFATKSVANFLVAFAALCATLAGLLLATHQFWQANYNPQPSAPTLADNARTLSDTLPWSTIIVTVLLVVLIIAVISALLFLLFLASQALRSKATTPLSAKSSPATAPSSSTPAAMPSPAPGGSIAAPKDEATRKRLRDRYALHLNNRLLELPDVFQPGGQTVSVEDVYVELMLTDGPDALADDPDALKGVTHRHMSKLGRGPSGERRTMQKVLDDPHRLWTLLGDPGSGKTTLLRHAALSLCEQPERVPVYLTASELVEGLEPALARLLGNDHLDLLDWLLEELYHGRVILLIDGLDEADPSRDPRGRLRSLSERFGVENTIIVASRPINFKPIAPTFQQLALCPLDEAAQERLLMRWIGDEVRVKGALARLRQTTRLRRLVENPLLLTLAGLVLRQGGELPTRRADLYDLALEVLVHKLHKPEESRGPCLRSPEQAIALLGGAALRLHGVEADVYPREALIAALRAEAGWRGWHPWNGPEAFVDEVAERTGLLIPDTGRLKGAQAFLFPHRTFREHLAATALAAGLRRWGGMDPWGRRALTRVLGEAHARPQRWAEVLSLACGRLGPEGADALIRRIINAGNTTLLLQVVVDAEGLRPETVLRALKLEQGWEMKQLQARQKVIEEIPALVKDLAVAVVLLRQVARLTTCGHDLFWVREVLRRIERGEVADGVLDGSVEDAKHAAKDAADNVLGHLDLGERAKLLALLNPLWRTIPAGSFDMGSDEHDNERPIHRVNCTSGFQMLDRPVTWEMYRLFDPGHAWARSYFLFRLAPKAQNDVPVNYVSWFASVMFAEWVGARLPLEPEWEYACRAGTTTRFWSGNSDEDLVRVGWTSDEVQPINREWEYNDLSTSGNGQLHPHPVAQKSANAWGLHDVHGNVYEWCADAYDGKAYAARADGLTIDPRRLTFAVGGRPPQLAVSANRGASRVVRGGSWLSMPYEARSAYRGWFGPSDAHWNIGFRLVLCPPDPP